MGVNILNPMNRLLISLGKISGVVGISLQAQKEDIGTSEVTMWNADSQDRYVIKDTAAVCTVVSTDAEDTLTTGTGVWTIRIAGLDGNYEAVEEVINMNGLTPVNTVNSYLAINEMNPEQFGIDKTAVGQISVLHGTDVLALVDDSDDHKHNITTQAIFTVPKNTTFRVTQFSGGTGSGDAVDLRLYANNPVNGAYILQDTLKLNASADLHKYDDYIVFPEFHTLEVTAQATLGVNREADVIVHGFLTVNSLMEAVKEYKL